MIKKAKRKIYISNMLVIIIIYRKIKKENNHSKEKLFYSLDDDMRKISLTIQNSL
jgi:hypothetical protein